MTSNGRALSLNTLQPDHQKAPGSPVVHGGTLMVFCGLLLTGLSFTDTVLVSKKIYQITRESEAKLKTEGDTPPDDKVVSKS